MVSLILVPILLPLALGLAFGLLHPRLGRLEALVLGLGFLLAYGFLEGWPAFPPTASKQKLYLLLMAGIALAYLPGRRVCLPALLLAGAIWLGWPKLANGLPEARLLLVLAPVVLGPLALRGGGQALAKPAALLVFAIGAAVLSLLGVFVGFAQVMGAEAALIGGVLAVAYLRGLVRGSFTALDPRAEDMALTLVIASSLVVALYAPDIHLPSFALLSLALITPGLGLRWGGLPTALRPIAQGALAAIPAGLAILWAALSVPA